MAPDVSVEECFRLARAMTWKNAAAGLPHGGGKAVIFGDPRMATAAKEQLIRSFAGAIRDIIDYIPGPDMGTDEQCMAWVKDEIGRAVGFPVPSVEFRLMRSARPASVLRLASTSPANSSTSI